jgi:DNA-binding HxlR family transcriptional regulator
LPYLVLLGVLSQMSEKKGLRPGEIKILKVLVKGNMSFDKLASETKLNRTCLSDYLKRLQKIGIIDRNIETRIYQITENFSEETLFISDIAQLIQKQVDKTVSEKNSFSFGEGFCTVENNNEFLKQLETTFAKNPENLEALKKINAIVSEAWKEFVTSSRSFNENERKIIRQIQQNSKELEEMTQDQIETKEKEFPYQDHEFKLTLSEIDEKRYDEFLAFMDDKKNQKIYEKWFNKKQASPKTLVIFTPLGFSAFGYSERIEKLMKKQADS